MESDKIKEVWKDVTGYEGYYQASNLGRARSLDRKVSYSNGYDRFYKGRIIEGSVSEGYRKTTLTKDSIGRTFKFSQLVAMAFLEHEPDGHNLVVDHINGDKADDRLGNLRIVTHRANTTTCFRSNEELFSSKYVGVDWHNRSSKWRALIKFNGNRVHLGLFADEVDASNAYQLALSKIKDSSFNPEDYKPKLTSKYKGVSFNKRDKKWTSYIKINGKQKHLGSFSTEIEAYEAYQASSKSS